MTAEERLMEAGYEDIVIFKDFGYDDALIGVSQDNRAIYDYDLMVRWLFETQDMDMFEAMEWIDYNTFRSLPYAGENAPIIMRRLEDLL